MESSIERVKLAEALLRRKELGEKVALLKTIKAMDVFTPITKRVNVMEGVDEIIAKIPKLTASQVTAEHSHAARQLRLIDAAIQQANWSIEIEVPSMTMSDYRVDEPAESKYI